jgi:hypothetical protein
MDNDSKDARDTEVSPQNLDASDLSQYIYPYIHVNPEFRDSQLYNYYAADQPITMEGLHFNELSASLPSSTVAEIGLGKITDFDYNCNYDYDYNSYDLIKQERTNQRSVMGDFYSDRDIIPSIVFHDQYNQPAYMIPSLLDCYETRNSNEDSLTTSEKRKRNQVKTACSILLL